MRTSTILTSLFTLATLSSARPAYKRQDNLYYGVLVDLITSNGQDPTIITESVPIELNVLTSITCDGSPDGCSVSKLILTTEASYNVNPYEVVCQGYKDAAGTEIGSSQFSVGSEADVSTNLSQVGSLLCWIPGQ